MTTAASDKVFKKAEHKRARRAVNALPATPELLALLDTLDQQLADEVTAA